MLAKILVFTAYWISEEDAIHEDLIKTFSVTPRMLKKILGGQVGGLGGK